MNMKKVLMVLITLAMVFTMAGAVSAADETYTEKSEGEKQTEVSYGEITEESYTIIIPSEVTLTKKEDGTVNGTIIVNVTQVAFNTSGWKPNQASGGGFISHSILNISVKSGNGEEDKPWELKNTFDNNYNNLYVPYTANLIAKNTFIAGPTYDTTMISEGAYFYLGGGFMYSAPDRYPLPAVAEIELKVTNPEKMMSVGEYKDTLTFNVSFEDYPKADDTE